MMIYIVFATTLDDLILHVVQDDWRLPLLRLYVGCTGQQQPSLQPCGTQCLSTMGSSLRDLPKPDLESPYTQNSSGILAYIFTNI